MEKMTSQKPARAYERLIKYAMIHTTSDSSSGTHPSFIGEWELANLLCQEMSELGLTDVFVDEHCYVYGWLPATPGFEGSASLGLIAHMDTSEQASGENVRPVLHENYDGGDIILAHGKRKRVLSPSKFPFLKKFIGETVITSDGSTLLGADDKAGIAEIITALDHIQRFGLEHGPIHIAFTPDEEIGEGTDSFDIERFGADFAYTVDGGDIDVFEYENFNAAGAELIFHGLSVHPGYAKDKMVNASKLAMEYQAMLPEDQCPERTEGREGFFHLTDMQGSASKATLHYIIRDHDRELFEEKKTLLCSLAKDMNLKYGEGTVEVTLKDSYFNMLEMILPHHHLIENALSAIKNAGIEPHVSPVRGGTDGARLSYEGLPCPNLGTGGHNFHGEYECITVERMDKAVEIILNIIDEYKTFRNCEARSAEC